MKEPKTFRELIAPSLEGVRACWPALLLIQTGAFFAVAAYYLWPSFQQLCTALSEYKERSGWLFAAVGSLVAGGIIPELLKRLLGSPGQTAYRHLPHQFALFAVLGVLVDRFYKLQSLLFGRDGSVVTLVCKVLFDQFVYTLLVVLPLVVICYAWQENGYRLRQTIGALNLRLLWERVLPMFVGNLCFWIPALVALYSLPTELQFLLSLILGSAWSLLLVYMARRAHV